MHLGSRHTGGLQAVSRIMAHHDRGTKPCPLCEESDLEESLMDHNNILIKHRVDLGQLGSTVLSVDNLLSLLVKDDIQFVYKFQKLYPHVHEFAIMCTLTDYKLLCHVFFYSLVCPL